MVTLVVPLQRMGCTGGVTGPSEAFDHHMKFTMEKDRFLSDIRKPNRGSSISSKLYLNKVCV